MGVLSEIKGIGPKTEIKLNQYGIRTISDLLFCFPTRYETFELNSFSDIESGKDLMLPVTVTKKAKVFFIRKNLDKMSFEVSIDQMFFHVHIFNRRFLSQVLVPGTEIVITGKFLNNLSNFTASNIVLKKNFKPGILPVYHFPDIKDATFRKIMAELLSSHPVLSEAIPDMYLKKRNIPEINELITKIHQPKKEMDILISRKRIIYEELLDFALRIESLKKLNENIITKAKKYDIETVKEFISTLPFTLTKDQQLATNEIFRDLKDNHQMNRLLQGDVGSGKTIIAVIASLAVVTAGYQVAIMAPTLVLAQQHLETFRKYLKPYDLKISLLTSNLSYSDRNAVIEDIRSNRINIIIGTHSLIQEDVDFHNLGFLVIDEQHRFGVNQRKELRKKGAVPDILLMSATPIPRTLAISIYKDIDISFIKQKPEGRKPVVTDIVSFEDFDKLLAKVTKELDKSRQAYFICPKIAESETSQKISVEEVYQLLKNKLKKSYTYTLLHGKMSEEEKNRTLQDFYTNKTQILISTTVVEVGINVRNATVMVIMSANAFGLAQLHQLRGRIGRDQHQSYCFLVVDDIVDASDRLKIMKETDDGFLISEYDLSIRGPGEVFGHIQSGIPEFKMANLINDSDILNQALEDASEMVNLNDSQSKKLTLKAIKAIESYHLD